MNTILEVSTMAGPVSSLDVTGLGYDVVVDVSCDRCASCGSVLTLEEVLSVTHVCFDCGSIVETAKAAAVDFSCWVCGDSFVDDEEFLAGVCAGCLPDVF